jgi:hypothetical protein
MDHPDHLAALLEADFRDERRSTLDGRSAGRIPGCVVQGIWGPAQFKNMNYPFIKSALSRNPKARFAPHRRYQNMRAYQDLIAAAGFKVCYTLLGANFLIEVRQAWGKDTVI